MKEEKNHINYTAQDIQRYLDKQMTPAEMHAFEKASLEDPFLAEALEGYIAVPVASIPDDIKELKERLEKKDEPARVVPLYKKIGWSAAAAILILFGVAATWLWLQPSAADKIAQQKSKEQKAVAEQEAAEPVAPAPSQDSVTLPSTDFANADAKKQPEQSKPIQGVVPAPVAAEKLEENQKPIEPARKATADAETNDIAAAETKAIPQSEIREALKREELNAKDEANKQNAKVSATRTDDFARNKSAAAPSIPAYIYKGKITDDQNKPLPFVNINIPGIGSYTYTDANGNFTLMSGDTQMVVHIKSVGFKPEDFTIHTNLSSNKISLKKSETDLSDVVVMGYGSKKKKTVADKNNDDEEMDAEPIDGWANYDIYLLNNERIPQQGYNKLSGTVDLSFTVNRYGHITDVNVEKSTCPQCEKEAIRLIKEGPRWKLTKGNSPAKVNVTLQF